MAPRDGPGTVYVLSNESFKENLFKVGRTGREVGATLRAKQLRSTGVPTPFKIEATFACSRMCAVERTAHELLCGENTSILGKRIVSFLYRRRLQSRARQGIFQRVPRKTVREHTSSSSVDLLERLD